MLRYLFRKNQDVVVKKTQHSSLHLAKWMAEPDGRQQNTYRFVFVAWFVFIFNQLSQIAVKVHSYVEIEQEEKNKRRNNNDGYKYLMASFVWKSFAVQEETQAFPRYSLSTILKKNFGHCSSF